MSFDSPAANCNFADTFQFNFTLLSDPTRKMGLAYGATKDVSKGSASRIAYWIDPQGRIAKVYPAVDARAFPQAALDDIKNASGAVKK